MSNKVNVRWKFKIKHLNVHTNKVSTWQWKTSPWVNIVAAKHHVHIRRICVRNVRRCRSIRYFLGWDNTKRICAGLVVLEISSARSVLVLHLICFKTRFILSHSTKFSPSVFVANKTGDELILRNDFVIMTLKISEGYLFYTPYPTEWVALKGKLLILDHHLTFVIYFRWDFESICFKDANNNDHTFNYT